MSILYQTYTHIETSISTVDKLLNDPYSIIKNGTLSKPQFLSFDGGTGLSNKDRIIAKYSETEKKVTELNNINSGNLSLLKFGTVLLIPKANLNNQIAAIYGSNLFVEQRSQTTFISSYLKAIQDDPNYKRNNIIRAESEKYKIDTIFNNCEVWVYVRALNRVVNITPFIMSINTSVSEVGTFQISFSPTSNIYQNFYSNTDVFNYSEIYSENSLNESWFVKNFQMNDIFFIKFEKLAGEKREKEFNISKSLLPSSVTNVQIYDMIGLMDNIAFSYNPYLNEGTVNISGRDCTKLLIEDASYFHPFAFVEGATERFFLNTSETSKFYQRSFVDGQFKSLFTLGFKSIKGSLGFIFNQLVNTGVESDNDLFSYYERKTKRYEVEYAEGSNNLDHVGVYQIVDLLVDSQLDNRRIVGEGISNPDGTMLEQVNKICQSPFVEFYGDTHGDRFVFTARQPPFTGKQILDYINNNLVVEIETANVYNFTLTFHTEYYTWYQIQPQNCFVGKSDSIMFAYFPAVLIPEYMRVFGNNRMVIPSNYISYQALIGEQEEVGVNEFRKAAVEDLLYIMESTVYLPFTRKGSIVIKGGDRRIKKGNWIYFQPTDEYFYVKSVTNTFRVGKNDIDRETTVEVERGMKKEYIKPKRINLQSFSDSGKDTGIQPRPVSSTTVPPPSERENDYMTRTTTSDRFTRNIVPKVSYFNILDIEGIRDALVNAANKKNAVATLDSAVNKDVLNFFLYKLQFEKPTLL